MTFTNLFDNPDGTALAKAMCNGGVNTAAHWGDVTTYTDCPPGPQSGVTDDLKDLLEVRDNYSATLQNIILIIKVF